MSPEPQGYKFLCPQHVVRNPRTETLYSPVLRSDGDTPVVHVLLVTDPGHSYYGWLMYRFTWSGDWVTLRKATPDDLAVLKTAGIAPPECGSADPG